MKRINMILILIPMFIVGLRAEMKASASNGIANVTSVQGTELCNGGQFMDLLLPMEGSIAATESDWGTTAGEETNQKYAGTWAGTLGRWKDNGIEDTERSYWGGNIIKGTDGKYHIYVSGWPESTARGHMAWSSASRVYHVVSDNVWGPYTYVSDIGPGHNSEIYKTGDTYVIYHIEPLGYYKSNSLGDTWESGEYTFDLRDRALIAGENRETSLSNCSFAKREDGSFVMIDRGGGIWISSDGLTDPWHQVSTSSVYLNNTVTNRGTLEDPVIWRDHLQYHMIVNDWKARYAYYYRSKDGLHWVMESGKAYTGQDPFAKHSDGTVEKWHKYERPRVYQDELGRAVRMNFAVIDCVKQSDLGNDTHSSKNINMPVTRQLLLEVQGNTPITSSTTSIRVLVKAEEGFNPRTDLNLTSLKFGSHDKVNFGNGLSYSSSENSGTSDLIITFTGVAGQSGITEDEWAPKMLGLKTDGSIAFGYAKMPGTDYKPAMLSAITPAFDTDGTVQTVSVTNYGESASKASTVRVFAPNGTTLLAHGTTGTIAAYASETVTLTKDAAAQSGYKTVIVRFYDAETLLNEETIALTAILAAQNGLQTVIDEANALLSDPHMTNGTAALQDAVSAATAVAKGYSIAAIEAQKAALWEALNTFKYANASPTNGLSITIPNAECNDMSEWEMTRLDASNAPGWKLNTTNRYGFDGNFIETYKGGGLKVENKACQTLTGLPAGRYRLRVKAIATNNGNAATGVALYAKGSTLTGSPVVQTLSTGSSTCEEYMLELTLTDEGNMEFGIDMAQTNNATWVCFDSWTLKYFGTADGDIVETERNTPILGINPQQTYHIKHLNTARNRYLASAPDASGHLLTTNADAEKGEYALLPVLGKQGYYYIYNKEGYYVTPSTGNWTLSKTTPAEVLVTLNNANQSALGTTDNIYLLGESAQHANPQVKDNAQVVYAYNAHDTDKGNNWVLEPVADATASVSLNDVTSSTDNLIASVIAEEVDMTYSIPTATMGYQTFAADYALDFSDTTVKAYIAKSVKDGKVFLQQVTKVPAGTGLILQGTDGEAIPVLATGDADDVSHNLLQPGNGDTVSKEDGYGKYVLAADNDNASVSFYLIGNTSATVDKGKAYLKIPLSGSSQAKRITLSFGDDTTGIWHADSQAFTTDTLYNVAGQRTDKPTQGLYISSGKKFYIK